MGYSAEQLSNLGLQLVQEAENRKSKLRLLGGIAVFLSSKHAAGKPTLCRDYKDLDFAVNRKGVRPLGEVFTALGWEEDRRFNALAQCMPQDGLSIYNTHLPPKDTPIDQAARLDETLKPIVQGGQIVMIGVGSSSVREAILKYQPALGLHGHVHEAAGAIRLGRTVCINPGSEYSDGILRGALITLDEKKKTLNYQLAMG
jgi:hypothetical protein